MIVVSQSQVVVSWVRQEVITGGVSSWHFGFQLRMTETHDWQLTWHYWVSSKVTCRLCISAWRWSWKVHLWKWVCHQMKVKWRLIVIAQWCVTCTRQGARQGTSIEFHRYEVRLEVNQVPKTNTLWWWSVTCFEPWTQASLQTTVIIPNWRKEAAITITWGHLWCRHHTRHQTHC